MTLTKILPIKDLQKIFNYRMKQAMVKAAKNSLMVDRNTGCRINEEGQGIPGIDQIEAFINKVRTEISKGEIPVTTGQDLIDKATNLIYLLKN
jgi:hypothetical protein